MTETAQSADLTQRLSRMVGRQYGFLRQAREDGKTDICLEGVVGEEKVSDVQSLVDLLDKHEFVTANIGGVDRQDIPIAQKLSLLAEYATAGSALQQQELELQIVSDTADHYTELAKEGVEKSGKPRGLRGLFHDPQKTISAQRDLADCQTLRELITGSVNALQDDPK